MTWPEALVAELAARRCVVFLGAGASAESVDPATGRRPPLWLDFLADLQGALPASAVATRSAVAHLLEKERYLDAAEVLLGGLDPMDFAEIVQEQLARPRFEPSAMHRAVRAIDPKVVATTNFDAIYESFCRSDAGETRYNVCRYFDRHLVDDLRSPVRLVVKIHGCVSDVQKLVLARSQYFEARHRHGSFFEVLDALFLTNTVLFLGYGLSDPDIQLLLENTNVSASSRHRHYALVEEGNLPAVEHAMSHAYNLRFVKFPKGDFSRAEEMVEDLATAVTSFRASNPP